MSHKDKTALDWICLSCRQVHVYGSNHKMIGLHLIKQASSSRRRIVIHENIRLRRSDQADWDQTSLKLVNKRLSVHHQTGCGSVSWGFISPSLSDSDQDPEILWCVCKIHYNNTINRNSSQKTPNSLWTNKLENILEPVLFLSHWIKAIDSPSAPRGQKLAVCPPNQWPPHCCLSTNQ